MFVIQPVFISYIKKNRNIRENTLQNGPRSSDVIINCFYGLVIWFRLDGAIIKDGRFMVGINPNSTIHSKSYYMVQSWVQSSFSLVQ